jgi:hypothetical protein
LLLRRERPQKQETIQMQSKYIRILAAVLVVAAATTASAVDLDLTRCDFLDLDLHKQISLFSPLSLSSRRHLCLTRSPPPPSFFLSSSFPRAAVRATSQITHADLSAVHARLVATARMRFPKAPSSIRGRSLIEKQLCEYDAEDKACRGAVKVKFVSVFIAVDVLDVLSLDAHFFDT